MYKSHYLILLLCILLPIVVSAQQDQRIITSVEPKTSASIQDARELPREGTYEIITTNNTTPQIAEEVMRSINSIRKYDEDFIYVVDPQVSIKIYSLKRIRQSTAAPTTTTKEIRFTHQD